jgi:SAM-dependent methyltransferase
MEQPDVQKRFANVQKSKTFIRIVQHLKLNDKKTLDLGCGFGEYMALCGKGSLGITTTLREVEYGNEHGKEHGNGGIRIIRGNVEALDIIPELQTERFEAIWSNNLFEHLLAPHLFLNSLKRYSEGSTQLILGVPVVPFFPGLMKITKFRGSLSSAHINFFTRKTLMLSVERAGWKILEARPFIFSNKFLDAIAGMFAPHIYVVALNDSNFKYPEKKLREWKDELHYNYVLETTGQSTQP